MAKSEEDESKRPRNNKFMQQTFAAWRPLMSAGSVVPIFFAVGIIFIPLGIALLVTSENVEEIGIDYTTSCKPSEEFDMYSNCQEFLENVTNTGEICTCTIELNLLVDFPGKVYLYYGLTNYYQNHRNFGRGRADKQLGGEMLEPEELNENCMPYRIEGECDIDSDVCDTGVSDPGYAPAGTAANSLFNDTFSLTYINNGADETVILNDTNIAWNSDKDQKFNNPDNWQETKYTKPYNWAKPVWELSPENENNNGYKNEDFIVWMRTSAFPSFRKFHRRVIHDGIFADGLPKGDYILSINYSYPVFSFDGTKHLYMSTTSWSGGKNAFLGIAYIVIGSIYTIAAIFFLVVRLKSPRHE